MESDWRFVQNSMNASFEYILETGKESDCTFIVGSTEGNRQKFCAHKFMLRVASPVFETMFFGSLPENSAEAIEIIDVEKEAFDVLLKFIYCVEFAFSSMDLAQKVYVAAEKYMMEHLKKKCVGYLIANMNDTNVLEAYEFVKAVEEPTLTAKAMEVFKTRTFKIVHLDNFKRLTMSTFSTILDLEAWRMQKEIDMFKLVEQYAFYQLHNEREAKNDGEPEESSSLMNELRELVKKIRFRAMNYEEFAQGPALSKLLTLEQSLAIYECLRYPSKVGTLYPKGFATNEYSRCIVTCGGGTCNSCRRHLTCTYPR